jgi:hypothetical protein
MTDRPDTLATAIRLDPDTDQSVTVHLGVMAPHWTQPAAVHLDSGETWEAGGRAVPPFANGSQSGPVTLAGVPATVDAAGTWECWGEPDGPHATSLHVTATFTGVPTLDHVAELRRDLDAATAEGRVLDFAVITPDGDYSHVLASVTFDRGPGSPYVTVPPTV